MAKLLNLGCGSRFCNHPDWTNVDFNTAARGVFAHNLLLGIPFPDDTFDCVYHSHLLEHLTKDEGERFVGECLRVLKNGGILRVVVPDLENIARLYLELLKKVESGDNQQHSRYEWIKLEMYDQTVRTQSGGQMARYLREIEKRDRTFIISRIGSVGKAIMEEKESPSHNGFRESAKHNKKNTAISVKEKLRRLLISMILSQHERKALDLGLFRMGGEVHQCMYDYYSLKFLLEGAGFVNPRRVSADESNVANWSSHYLDVDDTGQEHAPSSLYVEAVKRWK